ncbi:hypothetical protein [Variovorax sp. OV329]|uniref:hypothetical protein n=1 Tax=Variovorax sp. OV329 TaxID=1882825 RepID=UPI0008EAC519|nr:hypothetical protein [Variovorax sp. OV329]SFM56165.1 hypothetical protein SAMN05444747_106223 [Variovorax sp. OV329]
MRTDYTQYPAFAPAPVDFGLSVNAVLDDLSSFAGEHVAVSGILRFEFEGAALDHFPGSERHEAPVGKPRESSSLWLYFGSAALQSYESQFRRWNGARVIVRGSLSGPLFHGGCGYLSAWPAELMALSIRRLDRPEEVDASSLHPVRRRLRRDHQLPP